MRKLTKNQKKYFDKVVDCVAASIGHRSAIQIVRQSALHEDLMEDPVFVMHYDPEYWAQKILGKNKVAV